MIVLKFFLFSQLFSLFLLFCKFFFLFLAFFPLTDLILLLPLFFFFKFFHYHHSSIALTFFVYLYIFYNCFLVVSFNLVTFLIHPTSTNILDIYIKIISNYLLAFSFTFIFFQTLTNQGSFYSRRNQVMHVGALLVRFLQG